MTLTRLRAGALAALVVSFASLPAFAQLTPLFQSGVMTRARDLPMMTREGQIQDAAAQGVLGDANGRGVNPFAITDSNALGICTHTAPTGSSHHSLCLGHDANGAAIMTIDGSSYSLPSGGGGGGTGTVTSVGIGGPGGIFSTSGGPIIAAGTLSFGVAGAAGAIPWFSSTSQLSTSGLLTANMPVIGGGASAAPTVGTVTGTGTQFVVSNAPTLVAPALGTIASGNLSAGTVTATGGTTNSALAGRLGNMLDFVKDFGADPTGVVDACAVLATITTTRAIRVPTGKYLCDTNQTITTNLNLWGDGAGEYNQAAVVPNATGIQGTWFYRTNNVGLTITPASGGGYVGGGIRNIAFAESQPAIISRTGYTGTSGSAVLSVASTSGLSAGMGVSDITNAAYIPPGSTILSIVANTSVTISNNLTHNLANTDAIHFWKPTVYVPWLTLHDNTGEVDLTGIYCYGVYRCINNDASGSNGRMRVDHLRGQSFLHMVELDAALDSVWIYDVRDWPSWSYDAAVTNWTLTNGIPLYMGYANGGPDIVNFFAISKKACLQTYQSTGPFYARIVNFYCDYSKYGIWNTSSNGTSLQISNSLLQGGGYAAGTTAESVGIQDDGNGASGANAFYYSDSLICSAQSVACINGTNTTSGSSISVSNLQASALSGIPAVKSVSATGPYYFNIGNFQLAGSSLSAYYDTNNAILSGFTLSDGNLQGANQRLWHRFSSAGNEAAIFVKNDNAATTSSTCAATGGSTAIANNYVLVRACNNGAAILEYGSAVTSPAIGHAGGTLAIGAVSATSILTPTISNTSAPLQTFNTSDITITKAVSGSDASLIMQNTSAGASSCSNVYASANTASRYLAMVACESPSSAALVFGSAITSPSIAHAGGTLAIGVASSSGLTVTSSFTATGLVGNASLANPATTVNGQTCTLGSTCTVAAAAGTLTGAALASGVTASSLTSFGNAPTLTSGGSPAATLAFAASFPNWLFSQSNSGGVSQLKVSNTGSGASTYAEVTAATHGSGNYYMQFYVDEGGTEGVLTTGSNLSTGMRLQSASGGIRVEGVNTTTPAGGKNAVCADTGAQPAKIYISSGSTC